MSGSQYSAADLDSLHAGTLCTVLSGFQNESDDDYDDDGGDVSLVYARGKEHYELLRSIPLRVIHNERGLPYMILEVLKRDVVTDMQLPGRIALDKRHVQLIPVSREYVRQYLGHGYRTTL